MTDTNGAGAGAAEVEIDVDPVVFQNLADLEKQFARVELDSLRRKEFHMRSLYVKRNAVCAAIPNFWPTVLMSGPQEFQSVLGEADAETLAAVKSVDVERYTIKSETEGEPRSLRFTFEFDENDWFEDVRVVKEFEFVAAGDDAGGDGALVSKPVTFRWKKKGKKANSGLLDLAVDLYKAEEAVRLKDGKSGVDLQVVDRESLWQHVKLREKLEKLEEQDAELSWLDWFGYRGAVAGVVKNGVDAKAAGEDAEDQDEDDGMLDVEVFPAGEEIAHALAEDLWPNVMDYFSKLFQGLADLGRTDTVAVAAQQEPLEDFEDFDGLDSDEDSEGEDEAPDLIPAEELRPAKRQKRA